MYNQVIFVGSFVESKEREGGEHELILSREDEGGELFSFRISDEIFRNVVSKINKDTILGVTGSLSAKVVGYNRLNEIVADAVRILDDGETPRTPLN